MNDANLPATRPATGKPTATVETWKKLSRIPMLGTRLFSAAVSLKAPYFRTSLPRLRVMEPGLAVASAPKWWGVQNHIGTVHALAVGNGLEAAMGLLAEATLPQGTRWIPKGIRLDYVAKVPGDVRCLAETDPADWEQPLPCEVPVRVTAHLRDGTEVVRGIIPLWLSEARR